MGSLPGIRIKAFLAGLVLSIFIWQPTTALAETALDLPAVKMMQNTAQENAAPADTGEQQAAVSLEQAIGIAREAFVVPEGFNEFSTGFDQSENGSFWNLRWYRSGEPGGEMNVRVNSETGDIWSMGLWIPIEPGQEYQGLPRYSREQLEGEAAALAEKLQPERFKATRLQPARDDYYQPLPFVKRGQVEYHYEYARIVNGFPFAENGINISVSGDTGQVIRYDLRWDYTKEFPATAGMISRQQAEQIFRSEAGPQLYYFRERVPGGSKVPLKLVYRLPGQQNRAVIDALSGKVISREDDFYPYYDGMGAGGSSEMGNSQKEKQNIPLSPMEEVAVEEAKNLLSRDEALEFATGAVQVPSEYVLNNSRLEQDYMFNDIKNWYFSWQAGSVAERKMMDITVNAAGGELISFNTGSYFYGAAKSQEVKFSEEDALKIAEDYIKNVQPGRWSEVVHVNSRPDYYPIIDGEGVPHPSAYNFNWARLANGVQFLDNGFNVVVDSATGEITSYRMTWWDVSFPDQQGVMGGEQAADKYLREAPLSAAYLRLWTGQPYAKTREEGEVHLVYYTAGEKFTMLDAFTGQLLDFNGNTVTPSYKDQKFTDLDGHPAREAVELLARSGIVTTAGGEFRPDDAVTQAELITMLVKSSAQAPFYRESVTGQDPWYQQYYDMAARLGIIQAGENPDPELPVTREVLARLTIHTMDLYKVARLSHIYVLNFNDAGAVSEHLRGHVALAAGLGLIEPVDGQFEPKAVVSRGEAAQSLVRMLKSN